MRVAHSLMHQLEPADPGESNEQLAVHALQRAIESAPEVTDTRIMAFFRVGQTYARIAQKTMDEDPLKSDLYEMALMGFEVSSARLGDGRTADTPRRRTRWTPTLLTRRRTRKYDLPEQARFPSGRRSKLAGIRRPPSSRTLSSSLRRWDVPQE